MQNETEFWNFIASRLKTDECVMLLVVGASSGSSPGRAGYKMAVAADGELCGSIGGGVMEVSLVELAKVESKNAKDEVHGQIIEQVHRKDTTNSSGMICSGRQTVIVKELSSDDLETVEEVIGRLHDQRPAAFEISNLKVQIIENTEDSSPFFFSRGSDTEFFYQEQLVRNPRLFIIGGGHCALALSEVMSRLGFRIHIFDDRPKLNTIAKNEFADAITIIDGYDQIAGHVPNGENIYVVIMTLGYASDAIVIRQLIDHEVRYLGVLGSKAKMATLMKELRSEGIDAAKLDRIHTPIGLSINSRTPEEIAVSIAAEIIAVKNK